MRHAAALNTDDVGNTVGGIPTGDDNKHVTHNSLDENSLKAAERNTN